MRTIIASGLLAITAVVCGSGPCCADEADPLPAGAVARLGSTRLRTAGEIKTVAFSPDGRVLASGSGDGVVRLWDPQTGKEIRRLKGHEHGITSVAFTRDGKRLASGSYDQTCRLWDVATGKELLQLPVSGNRGWITAVALSPDGAMLACASRGNALTLYNAATGAVVHELEGHGQWVTTVVFAGDGKTIISGAKDRTIRRWDTGTGKEIGKFEGQSTMVYALALSPDSKTLVSASNDNDVHVWDMETGKERFKLEGHTGSVAAVACAADGRTIVSASRDGTVRLWDLQTRQVRQVITAGDGELMAVAIAPNNQTVASAGKSQTLRLWDGATGKEAGSRLEGHAAAIVGLAFSRDGKALVTNSRDNTLGLWTLDTGRQRLSMRGHLIPPYALALSADGKTLASLSEDRTARTWELTDGASTVVRQIDPDATIDLKAAADGELRFWATMTKLTEAKASFDLELCELVTGHTRQRLTLSANNPRMGFMVPRPEAERITAVAAAHHRPLVVTGSQDKSIILWDTRGAQLDKLTGHQGNISTLAFSGDDRLLASTATDGTLRLWEAASRQLITAVPAPKAGVPDARVSPGSQLLAALSPDGRLLAWAFAADRQIHVRDLVHNRDLAPLEGHVEPVTALAFSPDSRLLASGSADTTVLLWKAVPAPEALADIRDPDRLWAQLAEDAGTAYAAVGTLTSSKPDQTIAFLRNRLPLKSSKLPTIVELLNDLESPTFQVRRLATETLENMGEVVRIDVMKALDTQPSFEMQRRLEHILQTLDNRKGRLTPQELRQVRAVLVLEWLGAPQSRELLTELAKGPSAWWQTREAQTALKRLEAVNAR